MLTQLGIGEALISVLDEGGVPTIVKRCQILPPQSQMGALEEAVRKEQVQGNLLYSKYAQMMDRESAYEVLEKKVLEQQENNRKQAEAAAAEKQKLKEAEAAKKAEEKKAAAKDKQVKKTVKQVGNSAAGTIGREFGNSIGKTLGGSFGKKVGGNVGASLGRGLFSTLFKL